MYRSGGTFLNIPLKQSDLLKNKFYNIKMSKQSWLKMLSDFVLSFYAKLYLSKNIFQKSKYFYWLDQKHMKQ